MLFYERIRELKHNNIFSNISARTDLYVKDSFNDIFSLCIKKGEEEELINYLIGVHQGDNLAPLLFVLVFQAAMETLEQTEERAKISSPTYRYFPDTKKGEPRGRLTGQNVKSKGTEIFHWLSLYADDSAFILPSRDDAKRTANLVKTHLQRFGLQMHTGTDKKKSKTEVLHVPAKGKKAHRQISSPSS